ncbi:MAG: LysR family transcriptional regulator [Pseudonocardiaceae bacterium]|nr:LysR family transcriptional regulator [Pseudonocardiaceae bacterium]
MELRQLRYFTVLAEELHYGRAAERLYIAQPALSKQIASFERELGVRLFDRTRRRVQLTSSARLLLPEAKRLVEMSQRFTDNARRVREGEIGDLRLCYTGTVAESALPELLRLHHERCPSVVLSLRETNTQAALDDVRDGMFDAAFLRHTTAETDLEVVKVKEEPAIVAIPESHPYAARDVVRFTELRGQPLVMMTRNVEPHLFDHAITLCSAAGFSPFVIHEADSVQTTLSMVASGLGLAVVTASAQLTARTGVEYRPLIDPTPSVTLSLAYRGDQITPPLDAFLESVRLMIEKWATAQQD